MDDCLQLTGAYFECRIVRIRSIDSRGGFGSAERMRARLTWGISLVSIVVLLACWLWRAKRTTAPPSSIDNTPIAVIDVGDARTSGPSSTSTPTNVYAHNLMLRKGPTGFRVYVRWL